MYAYILIELLPKGKLYSVLYKLQYLLMHWAVMHKICKTK